MITAITVNLELKELHETLAECRPEPGLDYGSELAIMRLTGLTDEQIYCQWLTEANWLTMGDDPGLFARMQIDEPIAYGAGDLQHLMIAAAESNPLWHETFIQGLKEVDQWRSDQTHPVMVMAELSAPPSLNPSPSLNPNPSQKVQLTWMARLFMIVAMFVNIVSSHGKILLTQFRAKPGQVGRIQRQLQAFTAKFSGVALQQVSRMTGTMNNKSESL
jgi:hypothetical protein